MVLCMQGGGSGNGSGTLQNFRRRTGPTHRGEQERIPVAESSALIIPTSFT